jgi:hypothetical protein
MGLEPAEAPKSSGLKTALDIVVAPRDAFASLKAAPTWGWACTIAIILMLVGYFMQRPAQLHAAVGTLQHMMATNSLFANMTDEQKQKAIENAQHPGPASTAFAILGIVFSLFGAALLNTVVLLVGSVAARGTAGFNRLWAGSMNIAIPTFGLNYVVLGAVCLILGADHFQNTGDMLRAAPGLAMLAPGVHGMALGVLCGLNVFTIWGFILNVMMMREVAGAKGASAWIAPLVVLLGGALLLGAMSSFYAG